MKWFVAFAIFVISLLSANQSQAVKSISTKELAEHCIHCNDNPVKEVVAHVIEDLRNRKVLEERLVARDAVDARRDYPCDPDNGE